jgi:RNA polymerase sigma factor (sigma-70 family)
MSLSDGGMIAASLADPVRFAGIFDRHIDHVRRFVIRRLGESRGDDVVSEVFRVAFERRGTFDVASGSALPWLYGIATNLVRREHRSHARRLAALGRADGRRELVGDPLVDVAARLDARSELHDLGAALISLSDGEREILLLVAWEQLTPTEAAAVLGIPPETARTRLHRARLHIRTELERDGHNNEVTTDAN